MSVMMGDSVTLHTDLTDIDGVLRVMWRFRETSSKRLIVAIAEHVGSVVDENFRDRLQVDVQTGDLTVKNTRHKHSGLYEAEIVTRSGSQYKKFQIIVYDVPRVMDAGSGDVRSTSVTVGDSLTLLSDLSDIQNDTLIIWRFGDEGLLLAKHDKETDEMSQYDEETFRDRLKLNDRTGDLTISDVMTAHAGVYKLKISSNKKETMYKTFSVHVRALSSGSIAGLSAFLAVVAVGVVAAAVVFFCRMSEVKTLMNEMKSVSVTERDSVTLHTDVIQLQSDDVIRWIYRKKLIATVTKKDNAFFVYDGVFDGRFKGRLKLNDQTGSLTITSINMTHAGLYKVKMSSGVPTSCSRFFTRGRLSCCLFNVVVQAQMKSVSAMEGDLVTLPADLTDKHRDAVIEWMFKDEDAVIARFSRRNNGVCMYGDVLSGRFKDRVQVNDQTGDLTIGEVNVGHAGVYKLWIISSTGVSFFHFNVIVRERIRLAVLGQAVTLTTGAVEIQTEDEVQWTFGPEEHVIARIIKGSSELFDCDDVRFRDRLKLNSKSGSVTISNITVKHSGVYQVKISNNGRTKYKKFSVTISVLAKGGESVTLNTESNIQRGREIRWISDDNTVLVRGMNGDGREIRHTDDERYTGRLKLNQETGDLTITNITTEHNGVYKLLQIDNDENIPHRIFSVCVIDSAHGSALNNRTT